MSLAVGRTLQYVANQAIIYLLDPVRRNAKKCVLSPTVGARLIFLFFVLSMYPLYVCCFSLILVLIYFLVFYVISCHFVFARIKVTSTWILYSKICISTYSQGHISLKTDNNRIDTRKHSPLQSTIMFKTSHGNAT